MKTNSWNPNPAYVSQIISGQVQGTFDPSSLDGGGSGPFFVIYNWTTAGVWYSQDGTAGSFEPYGGNGVVQWQQGQASTTFQAQFFTPHFGRSDFGGSPVHTITFKSFESICR